MPDSYNKYILLQKETFFLSFFFKFHKGNQMYSEQKLLEFMRETTLPFCGGRPGNRGRPLRKTGGTVQKRKHGIQYNAISRLTLSAFLNTGCKGL